MIAEIEGILAQRSGKSNLPGGVMPGTDIPLPGMPPAPKAPLLQSPLEHNGEFLRPGQGMGGKAFLPVDANNLTSMERDQQSMLDAGMKVYRGVGQIAGLPTSPGDPMLSRDHRREMPTLEKAAGGWNEAIEGALQIAKPFALPLFLRNPVGAVAAAGAGGLTKLATMGAKKAVEAGPNLGLGVGDWIKTHPESVKLGEDMLSFLAGGKAFGKTQAALESRAAAPPTGSVQLFERVLRPGQNDFRAHEVIREAVPFIKQYDPQFAEPSPVRVAAQRRAGPLLQAGPPSGTPLSATAGPGVNPKQPGPGQVVSQTVGAAERAADDLMGQFDQMAEPWIQRGAVVDGNAVARAMTDAIHGDDILPHEVSQFVLEQAAKYQGRQVPLQEAMAQLRNSNAALNSFYNKSAEGQGIGLRTNAGDAAVEKARGDALRNAIYNMLDSSGEGKAPAQVMKLWGNVTEFKHMVLRRLNEAYRDEPGDGRLSALFGLGKSLIPGHGSTASAIENTIKIAGRSEGGVDKNLLDAFLKFEGEPKSISAPKISTPIGLLGAGPVRMPAGPDQSGPVRGPGPRPGMGMGQSTGARELPPATTRFAEGVPSPDSSGQTGNAPRPGMGMSPSDQRRALPAPSDTVRSVTTPDPPPNSYPGQEPERGLYQTPTGFSDPFTGLSGHQRTKMLQALMKDGVAEITTNGKKRMWRMDPGSKIRRLR